MSSPSYSYGPSYYWIIGVALSAGGCCIGNLGLNVQKLAHMKLSPDNNNNNNNEIRILEKGKSYIMCTNALWLSGFLCNIIGAVCDLISFAFADMSLLAPMGALTLVFNMFIAPCITNEILTRKDAFHTSFIVMGTIISIVFGSKASVNYTINNLIEYWFRIPFLIFLAFFTCIILLHFTTMQVIENRAINATATDFQLRLRSFSYPAIAGGFASFTVLFAKSFAEMVKQTMRGHNQFIYPFTYFTIVGVLTMLFLQVQFLNISLVIADSLFVIPVYQVFWVCCTVIVSMIYFQDFRNMSLLHLLMFLIGVSITLFGIFLLSQRKSGQKRVRLDSHGIIVPSRPSQLDDFEHSRLLNTNIAISDEDDNRMNDEFQERASTSLQKLDTY